MKNKLTLLSIITTVLFLSAFQLMAQDTPPLTPPVPEQAGEDFLIDDRKPTFVIVHGAWGGSWAFRDVEQLLRNKKYDVYRPSLTGLGERHHLAHPDINLTTHIQDVVNAILFEELQDIVLVGHSYGGMVISGVAHQIPERIHSMIYIDAFVPNDGESVESIQGDDFQLMLNMEQNGLLVPAWVSADQPFPRDVGHPLNTLTEPVQLGNEEAYTIPTVYIHAVEPGMAPEEDNFFLHSQRAKERGWPGLIIESDHNPQWSTPEKLVEMLHQNW